MKIQGLKRDNVTNFFRQTVVVGIWCGTSIASFQVRPAQVDNDRDLASSKQQGSGIQMLAEFISEPAREVGAGWDAAVIAPRSIV